MSNQRAIVDPRTGQMVLELPTTPLIVEVEELCNGIIKIDGQLFEVHPKGSVGGSSVGTAMPYRPPPPATPPSEELLHQSNLIYNRGSGSAPMHTDRPPCTTNYLPMPHNPAEKKSRVMNPTPVQQSSSSFGQGSSAAAAAAAPPDDEDDNYAVEGEEVDYDPDSMPSDGRIDGASGAAAEPPRIYKRDRRFSQKCSGEYPRWDVFAYIHPVTGEFVNVKDVKMTKAIAAASGEQVKHNKADTNDRVCACVYCCAELHNSDEYLEDGYVTNLWLRLSRKTKGRPVSSKRCARILKAHDLKMARIAKRTGVEAPPSAHEIYEALRQSSLLRDATDWSSVLGSFTWLMYGWGFCGRVPVLQFGWYRFQRNVIGDVEGLTTGHTNGRWYCSLCMKE